MWSSLIHTGFLGSRITWDTLHSLAYFAYRTVTFYGYAFLDIFGYKTRFVTVCRFLQDLLELSRNTVTGNECSLFTGAVWANPLSLATT